MRVLCLVFFCLSTAAALRLRYQRGKRYSYQYEGWIAHGIAEALEKDLALKIKAKAHLDYLTNGYVRMTLENVKLAKVVDKLLYNDRLETKAGEEQPLEAVNARVKQCLELPCKFKFKNGQVETKIFTEKGVREWCVNIQRAVVNHLYLPIRNNNKKYQTRENEVSILGKCKTDYTITVQPPYYKVKRAIDLTNCTVKPEACEISTPNTDAFYRKRYGRGTAMELPNFSRIAAYMHYDLEGDLTQGFLIHKVVSENVNELTFNGDQYQAGKAVAAHVKQVMTLYAKDVPIPAGAKEIKTQQERGGLLFVFDNDKSDIESDKGQENILRQVRAHIANIKEQLQTGSIKPETAVEFTRLVSALRYCTFKTLNEVVKDIQASTDANVRRLLLDAMARVGTEAAGACLKDLITGGKITKELYRVMYGAGWVRGLDTAYMKHIMAICHYLSDTPYYHAHRSCWLSFGNLVNRLMVKIRRYPRLSQDIRLVTFKTTIAKIFKEAIQNAKNDEERMTYLKAVGNAGWIRKDIFKIICDLIYNTKKPLHLRAQGIWSLRHMARVQPILIRQKLMPLFANPLYDPEMRISCYKILIQNDPSLVTCQMIAGVIAREAAGRGPRSNQVVSFIAADLRTSISYDYIDNVKASRARLLLRVIPRAVYFQMFSYSKGFNFPFYAGGNVMTEFRLNKINVPETFIPRHIHTKLKFNLPGASLNFFEFGFRMQGVHDVLMQYLGPKGNQEQRSIDILKYIFGLKTEEEHGKSGFQEKHPARLAAYFKLYGSEVLYAKLAKEDLLSIIRDALIGQKTATEGGCTFTAKDIKCEMPFFSAHLVTEKRCIAPTLVGFPVKYSGKVAAAVKGLMAAKVTGIAGWLASKFEQVAAKVTVKPTISYHVHQKVGVWLPIFESGAIIKNQLYSAPSIFFTLTFKKNGFKFEAPISSKDQQLLALKSGIHGVMREELTAGDRQWCGIDLQLTKRGFVDVPETCYGKEYFNLMLCKTGHIADPDYLRLKRLPIFPYAWLNNWSVVLKNDPENTPTKFTATYDVTKNTDALYEGMGKMTFKGETMDVMATMNPVCDKEKWTCETKWTFKNKKCPQICTADMTIDYAQKNRLQITTQYGGDKEMTNEVKVENEGKTLRIINTWNKLPEGLHEFVWQHRPTLYAFLHHYFGVKGAKSTENRCEVQVDLFNKFYADIFVKATTMKLRRINQPLPFAVESFYAKNRVQMLKRYYGICIVQGTKKFETTDNVYINEEIPSACPFVLAEDARGGHAEWRILLRKAQGGRQHLIVVIVENKIEFGQDKSVKVNGKTVELKPGLNDVPGGKVAMIENVLYFQANCGFECFFDGATTVAVFSAWWHYRIRGICGNDDGEQWTDFVTRRKTYMPERMKKEFLREYCVEGTTCNDPQCKLKGQYMKLASGAPAGKVCFTIGRFLRCMTQCTPTKKQQFEKVAYHCLPPDSPLIPRIKAGDVTVDLETMSVDAYGPVEEHLACQCNC